MFSGSAIVRSQRSNSDEFLYCVQITFVFFFIHKKVMMERLELGHLEVFDISTSGLSGFHPFAFWSSPPPFSPISRLLSHTRFDFEETNFRRRKSNENARLQRREGHEQVIHFYFYFSSTGERFKTAHEKESRKMTLNRRLYSRQTKYNRTRKILRTKREQEKGKPSMGFFLDFASFELFRFAFVLYKNTTWWGMRIKRNSITRLETEIIYGFFLGFWLFRIFYGCLYFFFDQVVRGKRIRSVAE